MKRISVIGLLFIILCVFFRVVGGEICLVPSSSMEPAILIGDWLWIDKLTYGARLPVRWSDIPLINVFTWNRTLREKDRGTNWGYRRIKGFRSPCISDIIVFNSPERPDILLVKRVAGVISAGDTITFNRENYSSLKKILDNEYVSSFMRKNNIYINGRGDSCYRVKQNYYFVLGDNSSESYDSRSFGYIPESSVVGKVDRVLFSIDCDQKEFCRFRFFRLFHRLH